ncbi:hypothetical protein QJQ45_027729 [Haematococcus lacustris]|nr:hypothetical protein QJQ45_027729 [Haematococcus lacustris]
MPWSTNKGVWQKADIVVAMRGKSSRPPSGGKRKAKAIDALPSKRRGKPLANEVYEAEESDPDEVKHAARYDRVDNFEYEMPSDFEDEEIDEELAFTEEDKKKYAGWFDDGKEPTDEGDEEEEGGHDTADKEGDSDVDLALLDSDAEVEDQHGAGDKGTDEDDELPGFEREDEAEDADDDGDAVDQQGDEEELYM